MVFLMLRMRQMLSYYADDLPFAVELTGAVSGKMHMPKLTIVGAEAEFVCAKDARAGLAAPLVL